ncbi:CCR4-NOT transcription complex subunit 2-like [Melanaphis sacchari]|uniref:CCR4-NOT transcription complex subunit 2-like n=1 Tax=Melanaphis sacchari TaxID=742174 RepID=UPI000DC13796|nr:CCR4-NOT transcription complex subunit 2-like [Melanaphis sacchari]
MQNHNMMPNAMPKNGVDNNRQTQNPMLNAMMQNLNKQNYMSNAMTQGLMDNNKKMHDSMLDTTAKNLNKEDPSMILNHVTQSLKRNSSLTVKDTSNKYVGGQNSANSLFTSCYNNLFSQFNFEPKLNCNNNKSKNEIHPNLNQSNFPLINKHNLSNNGPSNNNGVQYSSIVSAGKSYVKVMKNLDASEFKMSNNDFPALPVKNIQKKNVINPQSSIIDSNKQCSTTNIASKVLNNPNMDQHINNSRHSSRSLLDINFHMNGATVPPKPKVKISIDDGKVTNIPSNMVHDQFGIIGHLVSIKSAEYDPKLVTLTYGDDLRTLGLNMNSPENIYPTFAGPFENSPLGPHNIDFDVPPEYRVQNKIKNKLAPIKLSEYQDDLLFYLFYSYYGEGIQISVADELCTRGWSYHKELCEWIIPVSSGTSMFEKDFSVHGIFYVFDPKLWCKKVKKIN